MRVEGVDVGINAGLCVLAAKSDIDTQKGLDTLIEIISRDPPLLLLLLSHPFSVS